MWTDHVYQRLTVTPKPVLSQLLRKFLSGLERELNRVPVKLQMYYILIQCLYMYRYVV